MSALETPKDKPDVWAPLRQWRRWRQAGEAEAIAETAMWNAECKTVDEIARARKEAEK
jgi:hypothetical protein